MTDARYILILYTLLFIVHQTDLYTTCVLHFLHA